MELEILVKRIEFHKALGRGNMSRHNRWWIIKAGDPRWCGIVYYLPSRRIHYAETLARAEDYFSRPSRAPLPVFRPSLARPPAPPPTS